LGRVRTATLAAYEHRDLPFDKLVEELQPTRSLAHAPICQVFFTLQESVTLPALRDLVVEAHCVEGTTTKFDVSLNMEEAADGLTGCLVYRSDLFSADTRERWAARFATLLEAAGSSPDVPLSCLFAPVAEERARVVQTWNATAREVPFLPAHR